MRATRARWSRPSPLWSWRATTALLRCARALCGARVAETVTCCGILLGMPAPPHPAALAMEPSGLLPLTWVACVQDACRWSSRLSQGRARSRLSASGVSMAPRARKVSACLASVCEDTPGLACVALFRYIFKTRVPWRPPFVRQRPRADGQRRPVSGPAGLQAAPAAPAARLLHGARALGPPARPPALTAADARAPGGRRRPVPGGAERRAGGAARGRRGGRGRRAAAPGAHPGRFHRRGRMLAARHAQRGHRRAAHRARRPARALPRRLGPRARLKTMSRACKLQLL